MRALVTGAGRGIGAALMAEGMRRGHEVIGTRRDGAEGAIPLEVTDAASQARAAGAAGALDLLVCNAGVYPDKGKDLMALTADDLRAAFDVNVTGVLLTVQAQLANLGSGGRIAIISSAMGSSERAPGGAYAYRASKAAATNLGRNLAAALAPKGIAVGIYHPGWVRTDMGGGAADIDVETSARGLWDRFEALGPETTGTVETHDGTPVPF